VKVLIDTNIFLDVFLEHPLLWKPSSVVLDAVASGRLKGVVAADTLSIIYYLLQKTLTQVRTKKNYFGDFVLV